MSAQLASDICTVGAGWLPNTLGAPFETEALKHADSFVSCGGRDANGNSSDLDGDGVLGGADLGILLDHWGDCL